MKTRIISIAVLVMFMMPFISMAQTETSAPKKKTEVVKIATNLHCADCKSKIESDLAYVKGVKEVSADVTSKVVTVTYSTKKTSSDVLVERIQKLGYQAKVMGGCCPGGSTEGGSGCKGSGSGEGSGGCKGKQGGTEGGGCGGKH